MAYEIFPTQDICNLFGMTSKTIDTLTITNGCVEIGPYLVPLHKVLYIKNLG